REFALIAVEHHRAQRSRSPTTSDTGHAAKTGLVLKHQPNRTLAHGLRSQHGLQLLGQRFFFHSSCKLGWVLGCRVSGATLRQWWRSSSRFTTVRLTRRASLSSCATCRVVTPTTWLCSA